MKKSKGVALLWALILSSILLIISGTMVNFIVKESKSAIRIEDSAKAYAAARSGIDWGLNYLETNSAPINGQQLLPDEVDSAPGKVRTIVDIQQIATGHVVRSEGSSGLVRRTLEYRVDRNAPTILHLNNFPLATPNTESFKLGFDLWLDPNTTSQNWHFGLNGAGGMIYLNHLGNGRFNISNGAVTSNTFDTVLANDLRPYDLHIEIHYIKDTSAIVTVSENPIHNTAAGCLFESIPLVGIELGNLDKLYSNQVFQEINTATPGPNEGDGSYLALRSQTGTVAYIDNLTLER